MEKELLPVLIVSAVEVQEGGTGTFTDVVLPDFSVTVEHAEGEKCARCWMYSDTVGKNAAHPDLCERCAQVLES